MSYQFAVAGGSIVSGASVRTVNSFDNATANIEATGLGSDVIKGDVVRVTGSAFNNRDFLVLEVIDADNVRVYPAPTTEAGGPEAQGRYNECFIEIDNETTIDAASIATGIGNSELFGRVITTPSEGTTSIRWTIYKHLAREFRIAPSQPDGVSTFTSTREVWYFDVDQDLRSSFSAAYFWKITEKSQVTGTGRVEINIGELADPNDPRSTINGSIFLNGSASSLPVGTSGVRRTQIKVYNSLMSADSDGVGLIDNNDAGDQSEITNSHLIGNVQIPTGGRTLAFAQNLNIEGPLAVVGELVDGSDFTLMDDVSGSGIVVSLTQEGVVRSLEISDSYVSPALSLINAPLATIDNKEDYDATRIFSLITGSAGRKAYTWNPTLIDYNENNGPQPVAGATITVEKVTDGHVLNVSGYSAGIYTVTINGTDFNASGQGSADATRTKLINDINAGPEPVTAITAGFDTQFGSAAFAVKSDVDDTLFTISVSSPSDLLVLNPTPTGSAGLLSEDHVPGEITGSPFTSDANGRLNSGNGIELTTSVIYQGMGTINLFYRITLEEAGFVLTETTMKPNSSVDAQLPMRAKRMGII